MKKLYFVSSNQGKRNEILSLFSDYLSSHGLTLDFTDLHIFEIQATGEEIIQDKLQKFASALNSPLICEDSALCFRAWNDFPGVYIKPVREAVGSKGLFEMVKNFKDKQARGECRVGLAVPHKPFQFFEGKVEGLVVDPRGTGGFGWDELFQPDGYSKTYAEMTQSEKNQVSDRSIAVKSLVCFLEAHPDWLDF